MACCSKLPVHIYDDPGVGLGVFGLMFISPYNKDNQMIHPTEVRKRNHGFSEETQS